MSSLITKKYKDAGLSKAQLDAVIIDENQLDNEFIELPAQLAYWNALYTQANRQYLLDKHELRITEARLRLKMREEHGDDKPKPTNDDIIAYVHTDPEYIEAHSRYIESDADMLAKKKFAEAVSAKKDMLQSFGAKLRAEMETGISVKHNDTSSADKDDDDDDF